MADTDKDILKAEKEAEKAAKKAKQERIKQSKPKKDGTFISRTGKSVKKFWKDFTGTVKKIVWPGRTQVLKSSAVVLASIIVVGLVIFGIDSGLTALFSAGENLAEEIGSSVGAKEESGETTTAAEEKSTDEKDSDEKGSDESTSEGEETEAENTEAENTDAEKTEGENTDAESESSDEN